MKSKDHTSDVEHVSAAQDAVLENLKYRAARYLDAFQGRHYFVPAQIDSARRIAYQLCLAKEYADAALLWQEIIPLLSEFMDMELPGHNEYTLQGCRINLAWSLIWTQRFGEAITLATEAAEVCGESYGAEDESTLSAQHCLATALSLAGRPRESQDDWFDGLPGWDKHFWLHMIDRFWSIIRMPWEPGGNS